ncbi:PKD domain-containing protein [Streptomyces cellulosae]|uniref:PKD domain-containing protein n=1 Tax=Streptomyces cellulosae TaxID=1968 RepID=A0ABW6JE99_STRCE
MAGPVTIDWGDGTPKEDGPEQGTVTHKYADGITGERTITVCSKDDPTACTTVKFTPGGETPDNPLKVTAVEDTTDAQRMTVKASVDNTGKGAVRVDWGDGSAAVQGPEKGDVTYKYPRAGQFTITVSDADDSARKGIAQVTVPFGPVVEQPKAAAEQDASDATGRTAHLTWEAFPEGSVMVNWGDGTALQRGLDAPAGEATHQYGPSVEGEQQIVVTSETDATKQATATFTPKAGETPEEPQVTAESDDADATGRTVAVAWTGFPAGTVSVSFGDESPEQKGQPAPEGTLTHKYGDDVVGEQTITVVSDADTTVKATATFTPLPVDTPEEPEEPAEVKVTIAEDPADTGRLSVLVTADNGGKPVAVDFGDESEPVDNAGDGTAQSKHTYGAAGTYTVTVTDKDDTAKTGSAEVTVPFTGDTPAPAPTGRRRYR